MCLSSSAPVFPRNRNMLRRRMLIMLGVVLLIVLLLAGYKAFAIYQQIQVFSTPKPPVSVAVATATEQPWQQRLPAGAHPRPRFRWPASGTGRPGPPTREARPHR